MKKLLLSLYISLIHINCFSQAPTIQWQKCIGGSQEDKASSIIQTTDGGYLVVGTTESTDFDVLDNHGGRDFLIAKLDVAGNLQWKKCYGGTNDEFANCAIQTSDGGYIIGGDTESNDGDIVGNTFGFIGISGHSWVIKIDSLGTLQWQRIAGANNGETTSDIKSIIQTSSGDFTIGGNTYFPDNGNGYADIYIANLAGNGSSNTTLNIIGGSINDNLHSMSITNDGGYILSGSTYSRNGIYSVNHGTGAVCDYWIIKVTSTGIIEWQKLYGGSANDEANSIIQTTDGGYILAGYTWSNNDGDVTGNHGEYDYWIVKLDDLGNLVWQKCYGSIYDDTAYSIIQNSDGGYTVAGYARETVGGNPTGNHGNSDFWLARLNSVGTILWEKSLGGSDWDEAYCIRKTNDNGLIVCGMARSSNFDVSGFHGTNNFYPDFWIVKLSPENLSTNNFEQNKLSLFPNPSSSILNLQLSNNEIVDRIIITDLTGKVIINKKQQQNNINIQNLENGIYFIEAYSNQNKYQTKFMKI